MEEATKPDELYCFMDSIRECGPACMAYQTYPPEGKDYVGVWAKCRLLVTGHQVGKHIVSIANLLKNTPQAHPLPPDPMGKR